MRYGYAASPIGSLVWALTKGQVTGRGRLTVAGDGIRHLTGVNDLPSAWCNGRASDYSDRAALLLMSL